MHEVADPLDTNYSGYWDQWRTPSTVFYRVPERGRGGGCAVEVQQGMADRDAGVPEDERTTFRAFAQRANVVVAVQSPDGLVGLLYRPTMARPINFAAVPTATVNPKNGPKSRAAGMLLMKSPGILVWKR